MKQIAKNAKNAKKMGVLSWRSTAVETGFLTKTRFLNHHTYTTHYIMGSALQRHKMQGCQGCQGCQG
jgi:hypothetical protein